MKLKSIIIFVILILSSIAANLNAQSITWLGGSADAYDVSDNGNVVVGTLRVSPGITHAFRWTSSGGMQDIGTLLTEHTGCIARALSSDGSVAVGNSFSDYTSLAFRWKNGFMQALTPDSVYSIAFDVSADGNVVVGFMVFDSGIWRPFKWTASGGIEDLSSITGEGMATGVSDDGSVITGISFTGGNRVFKLTNTSFQQIENPSGFNYFFRNDVKVSGNGEVLISNFRTGSSGPYAFKWNGSWQNLGSVGLAGFGIERSNFDGSILVGSEVLQTNGVSNAFRWTSSNGIQDLNLIYSNLLIGNSYLNTAHSISSNGRFIVGYGWNSNSQLYEAYKIDTQSNLHITEPTSSSKFIAGETGLIKWTGGQSGQTLKIEYSINNGITYFQIDIVQATVGQYTWQVPLDILTTKAKIRITDSLNPAVTTESPKFKIKPYVLTRIDANGDYYEFRKDRDQWGFSNIPQDMWPQTWWQQFNYQGIDPFLNLLYSQIQVNGSFANSSAQDHMDWVSWVNTFGINNCYSSTQSGIYNPAAVLKWRSWVSSWGGSCFGIAVANALAFGYKTDFFNKYPDYPPFGNPISVTSDNQVKKVINELFTHQAGNPHLSYRTNVGLNKTPTTTLVELINMFKEDNSEVRTLSLMNNGPGGGGHAIIAYGLEKDTLNPDIYYVKVYDNSFPNSNNKITINTSANGGSGSWVDPDWPGWGGSKWLYLRDPVVNYLFNPTLSKTDKQVSPFILDANELQIFSAKSSSIKIIDQYGNVSGFFDNTIKNDILNSVPIILENGSVGPPSGYSLQTNNYSVILSDFAESISNTFFFTGNKSMMYERTDAITGQRDSLYFDGGIFVNNPDPDGKEITLLSLYDESTQEKLFTASGLQLLQDNSVKIENPDSNKIKIISYGVDNLYNIELNYVTENEFGRFYYSGLSLYPNISHIFVPEWTNLSGSDLKVLIDLENDGTIDDSLFLQNQATDLEDQGSLDAPNSYYLAQNYPNPFNPTTKIRFVIPASSLNPFSKGEGTLVTLKVYDILGNEVATLVNEEKLAGVYEVEFNASNLASGVYLYKLEAHPVQGGASSFVQTKKLVLIK